MSKKLSSMLSIKSHALSVEDVLAAMQSSPHGLTGEEAKYRLSQYGPNALPQEEAPGLLKVFLYQFASPLIYILIAAALMSLLIEEWSDAIFITAVLVINAVIGTIQEYSAQRAAVALKNMVSDCCRVIRDGDTYEIDTESLVPGDMILLESGDRVPADVRLTSCHDLDMDESLLTGESMSVFKDSAAQLEAETYLGDRRNMVFAGTLVSRGRGQGVVVSTALNTELGTIAATVLSRKPSKPPLLIRMENFTYRVAILVGITAVLLASITLSRGMPLTEIFLLTVALAVSAIPEGLPVALTVALAIGMRRMAKRHVIIRRLIAVEALGSCTFIATDKTGTLTVNQLTAKQLVLPNGQAWEISDKAMDTDEAFIVSHETLSTQEQVWLKQLCKAAVLPNDAFLGHRDGGWTHHGDAVDTALLVMAHKAGIVKTETETECPEIDVIAFESERLYAASLNKVDGERRAFVKGALERLLPMCENMASPEGESTLDENFMLEQAHQLASQGYRVLALANGKVSIPAGHSFSEEHLTGLTLIGLVGMIDPLRPEAKTAIASCHKAGINVAMITGDHPATALSIARQLDLADGETKVVTGPQLNQAVNTFEYDELTTDARVFARIEPHQKFDIVQSLERKGHFVAVSGDGANDAPALRVAHIGVAMGKSGTDVARETANIIITDDNFSSIVAGVEEGRIAYANVRKVIFLLISTGVSELVLFSLALLTGLPLPLIAVQLLWLNLVTNGIQDVALAFEPGEGHELDSPPRSPKEPIFNQLMIERVVISSVVIGVVAYLLFSWLLLQGWSVEESRNGAVLLMVLFENIHVFNSRSETRSALFHNPLRNPILLFGTIAAQLIHIGAMYTPWISDVLQIQPVSFTTWLQLLGLAFSIFVVMEIHKLFRRYLPIR